MLKSLPLRANLNISFLIIYKEYPSLPFKAIQSQLLLKSSVLHKNVQYPYLELLPFYYRQITF